MEVDKQFEDAGVESENSVDSESSEEDDSAEWSFDIEACDFHDEEKDFTKKFNAMRVGQQPSNKQSRDSKGKSFEVYSLAYFLFVLH